jgi:hypothetical protein
MTSSSPKAFDTAAEPGASPVASPHAQEGIAASVNEEKVNFDHTASDNQSEASRRSTSSRRSRTVLSSKDKTYQDRGTARHFGVLPRDFTNYLPKL